MDDVLVFTLVFMVSDTRFGMSNSRKACRVLSYMLRCEEVHYTEWHKQNTDRLTRI